MTINRAKSCLSRRVLHGPPQAEGAVPFSAPASMELHEALSKLAPKYRTVIHLFYYEGYTAEEIGALLRQKPATVARSSRAHAAGWPPFCRTKSGHRKDETP